MEVHFCDLCQGTLKTERHVVVIVHDKEFATGRKQYQNQQPRSTYEVCDSCHELLQKIFTYKKSKLQKIKDWIDKTYDLPETETKKRRSK